MNRDYVPEKVEDFFSPVTRKNWVDLVPSTSAPMPPQDSPFRPIAALRECVETNTRAQEGLGFLEIENPEDYDGLPTPLYDDEFKNRTVYTTSMTHQLHCLVRSKSPPSLPNPGLHTTRANTKPPIAQHSIVDSYSRLAVGREPRHDAWHVQHCFDYLRQGIMCCGDVALEGAETTFPEGGGGSDGWDARHVCRDYDAVYDYLEGHRAVDHAWI